MVPPIRPRPSWPAVCFISALAVLVACESPQESTPSPPPRDDAPSHLRHDLLEDQPFALVERETRHIQFGTTATRALLGKGWGEDEQDDVRGYVWGLGEFSELFFFAVDPAPLELILEGRSLELDGLPPQTITVELNGEELGTVEVGPSFAHHRITAPASAVRRSTNRLRFRYGHAHRPEDLIPGSVDDRELAFLWYSLKLRDLSGGEAEVEDDRLTLPLGTRRSHFLEILPGDELVLGEVRSLGPTDLRLRVDIEAVDGTSLASHTFDPGTPVPLPLPTADGEVRLALSAVRPEEPSALARARLTLDRWLGRAPPRIEMPFAVVMGHEPQVAQADDLETSTREPRRPNILIYLIDTLRADHLGAYGYELDTSPRIDAFAAEGVLFENARAQTSWTRTAIVSLFTGLLPQVHGVNRREDALAPSVETLAERLSEHGYRTAGIVTNGNASENFGLHQGFDEYIQLWERNEHWSFHQLSDRVNQRAFRWFDAREENIRRDPANDRPFLLYVHTTDPHGPYTPPEPFYSRFAAGVDKEVGHVRNVYEISSGRKPAPPGTAEDWIRLYDGEIAFNDHHFGLLLDDLKARGLYDSTLIVLTSDHGEEFFEHGDWEHGKSLYDEQLLIPLIIKPPADWAVPPGQRIAAPAHQTDLLPTLLDALAIPPGNELDGRSLLPLLEGMPEDRSPPSIAYLELGEYHQESVTEHGFKLIRDLHKVRQGDRGQLFDLNNDPGEQIDRNHTETFRWGQLRQLLEALHFDLRQRSRGIDPEEAEIDEALLERLEALGYTD